ncbi:acyltransferase family protein [Algicella marina]|uniref:Acyltransferase family protein n=1 Tax=Algicella marina TaxID=2683284 RepID=A0A6P1T3U3_9RHOB|nr:acyltransferase [Algicella marina]QHQ36415.1 acyltransferase family protein [Algicella marina]
MSGISLQITKPASPMASPPAGFSPGIHGARGLFALCVVLYHVYNSGLPVWSLPAPVHHGLRSLTFGVEMFFAISGYVIIGTLARSDSARAFLHNRASRILPLLWLTTLVYLPLALVAGLPWVTGPATNAAFPLIVLGNLFALAPLLPLPVLFPVAWTICYEFAFYILAGATRLARRGWPLVVLVGLAICLQHPRALFFLPGILVALGLVQHRLPPAFIREPLLPLAVFLAAWSLAANPELPRFEPLYLWADPARLALAGLALLAATAAILGISEGRGLLGRVLQTRPLMWLGTISYSLYLWHTIIIGITKAAMRHFGIPALAGPASQLVLLALALPASLFIAHVSAEFLEKRVTRTLRRRITA